MSNKSVTINFTDPTSQENDDDDDGNVAAEPVSFELDSERHIEIYGEAKTTFSIADTVYLRLLHQLGNKKLVFFSTNQKKVLLKIAGRNVHFGIVETLSYTNSNSESITYSPADTISSADIEWLAPVDGDLISVRRSNKEFKIISSPAVNNTVSGSLQVSYTTLGDRLEVTSTLAGSVIVGVTMNGVDYSQTITFTDIDGEDPTTLKTYTINVNSLCAEGVIGGVYVTKDGVPLGYTNGYGQITFTAYPGSYTFMASRTGYTSVTETVTLT